MHNSQTHQVRPNPDPVRSYHFPSVQHRQTSNGIRIIVAEVARVPLATLHYVIDGGAIYEPASTAGLAQLTARGLAEGTATLTGDDIAQRFELLGSSFEPDAGWETMELRNTVQSSQLHDTAALCAKVLTSPAFRDEDLSRLREERIAELMHRDAEPRGLADDSFARFVYGTDSRLQFPIGGERETIRDFSASAAQTWHQRMVRPERLAVIAAGNVSADDVLSTVEQTLGSWRVPEVPERQQTARIPHGHLATYFVSKAAAPQSELRIGHTGPPRSHSDFFAITVLNAILGGLFGSRLNLNLREKHGYTYGAFSSFQWRRDGSTFCVSTAVQSDATFRALQEIRAEIDRVRGEAVSAQELSLAVEHLQGVFPIRFETTDALANAIGVQHVFRLPRNYFDEYRDRIGAVNQADVLRVAQEQLRPDAMLTCIVGNASLQDELRSVTDGDLIITDERSLGEQG